MTVGELAYTDVLGVSMVVWGGMLSLLLLVLTFLAGFLNKRGIHAIPFKYHGPLAYATVAAAVSHGLIGLLASLGY